MWREEPHRLALLELRGRGVLRRRTGISKAWDELARLPWTRRTGRSGELALVPEHRGELEQLLDRCWPEWKEAARRIQEAGFPMDTSGWKRLKDQERQAAMPLALPERLNLRTAAAVLAEHSKATLSEAHLESLGTVTVTRDGIVRLRPSPRLRLQKEGVEYDAGELARVLGEVTLTERAIQDGTRLAGERPAALLLVENVGPYIDLSPPPGWLVAHVPGWNTATVRLLIEQLAGVPIVHFGDLDPNGLGIFQHLRELCPSLLWAVPDFWSEHIEHRARACAWPNDIDLNAVPGWVRDLARRGLWLEQELITLDPRLPMALEAIIKDCAERNEPAP